MSQNPRLVIHNCDNTMGLPFREVDDGLTLLYLLGRPDIRVLGVTTTFGNGTAAQAYHQTRQMLDRYGHPEIPVWQGAAHAGDIGTGAARFLADQVAAHPGEITVLATGPVGNLYAANELDPHFYRNLAEVACMGGYRGPLRIGRKDVAELNLSCDPKASWALLNAGCPLTVMSAQTCLPARFGWGDLVRAHFVDAWMQRTLAMWLAACGLACGTGSIILWDLLPAVYLSFPELFDRHLVSIHSTVEDLRTGSLKVFPAEGGNGVNLPRCINDLAGFKKVVGAAWQQTL